MLAEGNTITASQLHESSGLRHVLLIDEEKGFFSNTESVVQIQANALNPVSSAVDDVSAYSKAATKVGKALNFADLILQAIELSSLDQIFVDQNN